MVKFLVFVCFLLLRSFGLQAQPQNLVPNPSFEEHSCCPCLHSMISCIDSWFSYHLSPDYFNYCYFNSICDTNGAYGFGTPNNSCGVEVPKDGDAYIGSAIILGGDITTAGESFGVKLLQSLERDVLYCYSFWVSLADSSEYNGYDANIGFLNNINTYYQDPKSNFHFIKNNNKKLFPSDGWLEITGSFVANGSESYLIVGNFIPPDTSYIEPTGLVNWSNSSYVFFDLFSLIDCDSNRIPEPPNVITPNMDGINDIWTFNDYYNTVGTIEIFNRWGNVLYTRKPNEPINWAPVNISSGIYFYIIQGYKDITKQKRGTITVLGGP